MSAPTPTQETHDRSWTAVMIVLGSTIGFAFKGIVASMVYGRGSVASWPSSATASPLATPLFWLGGLIMLRRGDGVCPRARHSSARFL